MFGGVIKLICLLGCCCFGCVLAQGNAEFVIHDVPETNFFVYSADVLFCFDLFAYDNANVEVEKDINM